MTATQNWTVPPFGLGTFRLKGQVVRDSVRDALELGYRAIDTAQGYDNEGEIGQTIADSGVDRSELYITTKIKPDNYSAAKLVPSLRASLDRLQTDAVDLTLIHWPAPRGPVSAEEYLGALADAHAQGLTRNIGVSNFTIDLLKQARELLGDLPIATNQVEIHPYLQNRKLADFARQEGIHLTSYMTLAVGKVMEDDVLKDIAGAHGSSPAQVALAWALKQGYSVIPSSTSREHLASNLKALDLQLSDEDMGRIAALDGQGERLANPASVAPDWD